MACHFSIFLWYALSKVTFLTFTGWQESFASINVIHSLINWTRFDFVILHFLTSFSSYTINSERRFVIIWLLSPQIQCVLQDVGSNIATPQSSARESHISMIALANQVSLFLFIVSHVITLYSVFCKREQNLLHSQLWTWRPGLMSLQKNSLL